MAVYKRKGTYYVRFEVDGEEYRRSARTASKTEAEKFERRYRADVESKRHKKTSGLTFGEALNRWLDEGAPYSMYDHVRVVAHYLPLAEAPLEDVVPAALQFRTEQLRQGLAPTTVNRRLSIVRRVLNIAHDEWLVLHYPLAKKVKLLSEKGRERHVYLTHDQLDLIMGQIPNENERLAILLAAFTGLRANEVRNLTPDMVQGGDIVLPPQITKSSKPRAVPLVPALANIAQHLPLQGVGKHRLAYVWRQAREKAGMPHVRIHDLRHTFASWLAKSGASLVTIRDLLGHSNLAVTSRYAHLSNETHRAAIDALAAATPQKELTE